MALENLENGRYFPSQGILNFDQDFLFSQGKLDKNIILNIPIASTKAVGFRQSFVEDELHSGKKN